MPSTIDFKRGDVVLVSFLFADESGTKVRPALVVSSARYHRTRRETIVAAITSNVTRRLAGDHALSNWKASGLLFPSIVTGIIRTVEQTMIRRRLGALTPADLAAVEDELRKSLNL